MLALGGVVKSRRCIDCGPDSRRPAPEPGPRCATHWRIERKRRAELAWSRRISATYGIRATEYLAILEAQGGRCFICQRATGATKRLAVDHDHSTGAVRGLLCGPCNRGVVGHLRDDVDAARRLVEYLTDPPAVRLLGVVVPGAERNGHALGGGPEGDGAGDGDLSAENGAHGTL